MTFTSILLSIISMLALAVPSQEAQSNKASEKVRIRVDEWSVEFPAQPVEQDGQVALLGKAVRYHSHRLDLHSRILELIVFEVPPDLIVGRTDELLTRVEQDTVHRTSDSATIELSCNDARHWCRTIVWMESSVPGLLCKTQTIIDSNKVVQLRALRTANPEDVNVRAIALSFEAEFFDSLQTPSGATPN
jgi:hypothetical protein